MADAPPTVVLTGVSTGIGRASLQRLLQAGCCVFGSVRKQDDADKIAVEVANLPGTFRPLVFDVTDADSVAAAAAEVNTFLEGRTLSALVNNAGINVGPDPMELIPLDKFRSQLEVNLIAPVRLTQVFLPLLGTDRSRRGKPGRVVFLGSIYGSYGLPWQAAYCATKHALEGLSESLRLELMVFGIPVILIKPGPVRSDIWDKSMRAEAASEKGTGDWARYAGSQYAAAMASTRKFVISEMDSRTFYLPCEAIAERVHEAVTAGRPQPWVVETSRRLEAWLLPRWVPISVRDLAIARKLGLRRLGDAEEST